MRMLAMPVATQWPMNFAQALLWAEGLGCPWEACSALSCSYWTRVATRCLTALCMCLGVARFASCGPCSAWCASADDCLLPPEVRWAE